MQMITIMSANHTQSYTYEYVFIFARYSKEKDENGEQKKQKWNEQLALLTFAFTESDNSPIIVTMRFDAHKIAM